MGPKTARWIARLVVAGYLLLATAGFILQRRSGSTFAGFSYPFLIAASLLVTVWTSIGALIIHRHPRQPIGWILLLALIAWGLDSLSFGYLASVGEAAAAPSPLPALLRVWLSWSGFPFSLFALTLLLLRFPTGSPHSTRWARLQWFALGALVAFLLLSPLNPATALSLPARFAMSPLAIGESAWLSVRLILWATLAAMLVCLLAAAYAVLARFRRSRGEERQQLKWFLFAGALLPLHVPTTAYAIVTGRGGTVLYVGVSILLVSFIAMALAIGVSMFKYRLYDVDRLINRTAVYGLVTGALVVTYLASGFTFQSILRAIVGQQSPLAIVVSTLLIAALFQPLRRRVQEFVDRRFYRRKYVAEQLLGRFGIRLQEEVDPELVSELLLDAVDQSLQPASSSLWLRAGT